MRRLLAVLLLAVPLAAEAKKPPPPPPPPAWSASADTTEDLRAGNAAILAGKPEDAVAAFDRVLAAEPSCGIALVGKGRALVLQGKAAEALPALDVAATTFPDKLDAHVWRARALLEAGRGADALTAAKAALAIKPGSVDAQKVAQAVLRGEKRYAEAHAMIAEVRKVANLVAFNCLEGLLYADEGDFVKAAEMDKQCEGVPDVALRKELADRVAAGK